MGKFQEFLQEKVKGTDWKARSQSRGEWLGALHSLLDQIRVWLREADPEGLLEVVNYEVERVEHRLGVYDAPAVRIVLGTASADVLPAGRYVALPLSLRYLLDVPGNNPSRWGDLSGGRVDITDGERRHLLVRSIMDGGDRWFAVTPGQSVPVPFDRERLEAILQDLLS